MSGLSPGLITQFRWVRQLDVSASQLKVPYQWKDGRPLNFSGEGSENKWDRIIFLRWLE